MATTLWGKVYFHDRFAGILRQEPGERYSFVYDADYIASALPAIAYTLPVREAAYYNEYGLHPFFDNLVAEGWLRNAQARALGVAPENRFALLLAFGWDCAGAVSLVDPEPQNLIKPETTDPESLAALASRASLSGIQPKILVVKTSKGYRPANLGETSTHIAKLPSGQLLDIIDLEWLTTLAAKKLLPEEPVVEMEIAAVSDIADKALIIRRFDRAPSGEKIHFEEFNQLLGKRSQAKYDGGYEDMARFIRTVPECIPAEAERLFRRVLVCFLLGNTDAHLKNFALFHQGKELHLTPGYDLVASAYYSQYQTIALFLAGVRNLLLGELRPKHIVRFGEECGLSERAIRLALKDIEKRLETAKAAIRDADIEKADLKIGLIKIMEKRWNGTFESIGPYLSKKQESGEKNRASRKSGSPPSPK